MADPVDPKAVEVWISGLGTALLEQKDAEITTLRDEITRLRAALREIAKPWTARSLSVADLRQAAEMVIAELERRRAVAEAALGGGDE